MRFHFWWCKTEIRNRKNRKTEKGSVFLFFCFSCSVNGNRILRDTHFCVFIDEMTTEFTQYSVFLFRDGKGKNELSECTLIFIATYIEMTGG